MVNLQYLETKVWYTLNDSEKGIAPNDVEVYEEDGDIKARVEIIQGDWKHTHLYCDHLMNELGFTRYNIKDIDEDEEYHSDTYSAVREYVYVDDENY